ncbi:DUF2345 domain-containing protein, partial [Raoultella terrigena]
ANPADLQAQIKLLEQQLTDLKKAVLLLSAPDGMALTSGQHLQVSAGQNLIATAGKNADVSVVKNLFIGVGNALSVFVRKLGIKLIANQGPVQLQAQNDMMALLARKEISIVSTEDEIKIIAKKKLTLNGGGSYITIDGNAIELATLGDFRTRAGHYARRTRAQHKPEITQMPPKIYSSYNRMLNFKDEKGIPYSMVKYFILMSNGTEINGVTDEFGNTQILTAKNIDTVRVHLIV